jgi:hypothetical protein
MRLLAATLFAVLCFSQHALASELALTWHAPSGCPGLAELQAGLETRQGRPVQLGADAPVRVDASVTRDRAGFRLDLRTHTESGDSRRELYTQSCNELARATLLVAALLLSTPPPAATVPAPGVSDAPSTIRTAWHVTLAGVLDAGKLVVFAPGAVAKLGLDLDALRLRLGALYLPPRGVAIDKVPGASVDLQLMAAEASLCYAVSRAPLLASCAYAELGSLRARGRNLGQDEVSSSLWFSAGLGAQLGFALTPWLDFEAELTVGSPFRRAQIATRDLGRVYQFSAVYGQLQAGLCAYLP